MNILSLISGKKQEPKPTEKKPNKGMPKSESEMFSTTLSKQPIIALLKSEVESEKLTGMKLVIAMQMTRKDVSPFVPYVVNLITTDFKVKKLTYFFLCYCSGNANKQILMSINSFHKDLTDSKPLTRASALRSFSSLKIDETLHVLTLSLQRGVSDFSIYVRRAACYALIKVSEWEDCDRSLIIQLLNKLLADSNVMVVGPALMAFNQICPEKLDLIHGHFRRIVRSLPQIEFIFVANTLQVLVRYARIYLDFQYIDSSVKINNDMKVLLETAEQLLYYDSPSLIIAVGEFYLFFRQEAFYGKCIFSLLSFRYFPYQISYMQLCLLLEYALVFPAGFAGIYTYFYVNFSEHIEIVMKKLEILAAITTVSNAVNILKELSVYTLHENPEISATAITTIGKICEKQPNLFISCTKHLIKLLKSKSPFITAQVIIVMRKLINQDPQKHRKLIVHCAKTIETITYPTARACALWIIGKYYSVIPTLAAETMRKLALSFSKESSIVKHQLINSTCKIYSETNNEQLFNVLKHLLDLGAYDLSYDIRDKCRLIQAIFVTKELVLKSPLIFESSEMIGKVEVETSAFVPLSLSYLIGNRVKGYEKYWDELVDKERVIKCLQEDTSYLRDEEVTPIITVKQSTSYSNADVKSVSGSGLVSRVRVNDPSGFQAFLENNERDEEEEDEDEEEEEEEDEEEEDVDDEENNS